MLTTTPTTTVLNYAIAANPDPLQVSSSATISIVAAKRDRRTINYTELQVKIVYAQDPASGAALTADIGSVSVNPPPNWTFSSDGAGTFTFTPQPGYGTLQPDDTLMFVLGSIAVNNQVGTTTLTLVEKVTITNTNTNTNTAGSQTLSTQTETYPLGKFPQGFVLSEMAATQPIIGLGDTTTLTWTGSPGSYTLQYNDQSIPITQHSTIAPYSYPISGLPETTSFTLSVTAQGGTVQAQRQYTVTVLRPEILSFKTVNNVTELKTGTPVSLAWQTQNATACALYINGVLSASGLAANNAGYVVNTTPQTPGTATFVLVASGSTADQSVQSLLPIFMYRFELLPQSVAVGPMPYQLVLRPDSTRLYVVCQYPYEFGAFNARVNQFPNGASCLYAIDTYNLSSTQVISQGGAIPQSDPLTQCLTRLAINPQDAYRFYFFSEEAVIVDCDTKNDAYSLSLFRPYVDSDDGCIAIGVAGTSRTGNLYPGICYHKSQGITDFAYLDGLSDSLTSTFYLNQALTKLGLSFPGLPLYNAIWSIAAVPGSTLIVLSLAGNAPLTLVRVSEPNHVVKLVQINNYQTSGQFPPAVTFLANSNGLYCVAGVDASTKSPMIVVMDQTDTEVRRIPVPAEVRTIVASPDGYHLYASLCNDQVIRVQTGVGVNQVIDTMPVGAKPWALAINPEGTRLYVGDVVDPIAVPNGKVWTVEISDGAF